MKARKIILTVLISLVALVVLVLGGFALWERVTAGEYYAASEKAFEIPGISEGVIGQALWFDGERDLLLAGGYMKDNSASRLYLLNPDDGKIQKTLFLADENGAPLPAHCACLAVNGPWTYITGDTDCSLYVFETAALQEAADGAKVPCVGRYTPPVLSGGAMRVNIVCLYQDCLVLGEFRHPGEYETPEDHKTVAPDGSVHRALCLLFPLEDSAPFGVSETPRSAWSIPDDVQGITIDGGRAYLSISYGAFDSRCECYDLSALPLQQDYTWNGCTLPLSYFDSSALVKKLTLPPMSEQMVIMNNKLYIMSEAASAKYLFGRLYGGADCYATDLSKVFP